MPKQVQQQKQNLLLTQKMDQSLKILQMNQLALKDYLEKLSYEIPLMEVEYPDNSLNIDNEELLEEGHYRIISDSNTYDIVDEKSISVKQYLYTQVNCSLSKIEERYLLKLLDYIDDRGLFNESESELIKLLKIDSKTFTKLIRLIQSLYPKGVGAFSLNESLLLQCDKNNVEYSIIKNCYKELLNNRQDLIARKLKINKEQVTKAIENIKKLNPYPLNGLISSKSTYIVPDVIVSEKDNAFEVVINHKAIPEIKVNDYYRKLYLDCDASTKKFLSHNFKQVDDLLSSLKQRYSTLELCASLIVSKQEDFFLFGQGNLSPLSLNYLSSILNLSESTISRTLNEKYLECRFGTYPLSYFLSRKVKSNNDEEFSADELKRHIQEIISKEDKYHPLSDNEIVTIIKEKGFNVSRRTIVKYRSLLSLPASSKRRLH